MNLRILELLSFVTKMERGKFHRAEMYVNSVTPITSFTHPPEKHIFFFCGLFLCMS